MRRKTACTLSVALFLNWAAATQAQETPPADDQTTFLLEEVAGLNRSLEEIATLLSLLLKQQHVDILIKRIELKERRLSPLQSELRGTQDERTSVQEEIKGLEAFRKETERQLDEQAQTGLDTLDSDERRMLREMELRSERLTERLERLDQRAIELENDFAASREEITILDEMLAEQLGLR